MPLSIQLNLGLGENVMLTEFIKYLKDEDGQTSTEYILLVAVVAMIVLKFRKTLDEKLTGLMGTVFGKVDQQIGNGLD